MEFLNNNAGIISLIFGILAVVGVVVTLIYLLDMRKKIAVQKVKFLGLNEVDLQNRKAFAKIVVGNKSVNDMALIEFGVRNGKVSFNLTGTYNAKKGVSETERIVIEQRNTVTICLDENELQQFYTLNKKGKKVVSKIYAYAVDSTGNYFVGRLKEVERLVKALVRPNKDGGFLQGLFAKKQEETDKANKPINEETQTENVSEIQQEVVASETVEQTSEQPNLTQEDKK